MDSNVVTDRTIAGPVEADSAWTTVCTTPARTSGEAAAEVEEGGAAMYVPRFCFYSTKVPCTVTS